MCGIAAIFSLQHNQKLVAECVRRMNDELTHRGPDGAGTKLMIDGGCTVALGHRRLSIIDLVSGQQPMSNEDGTVWITYNGEIYNHLDLRRQLESCGHQYKTTCDTETIVHAFEEWGPECVNHFRGMFAFVIWDARRQQLFAARDRLGIKPLYYVATVDTLIIASEMKAILSSGLHTASLSRREVPELMTFGYLAGEKTLFEGVNSLLPGHSLSWKQGVVSVRRYWEVPSQVGTHSELSEAQLVSEFSSLFDESVRIRLMSDVPLGLFLSGGLDSSAIAVTMAEQMSEPLKTFSVGYESGYYSEFDYAREVATAINADHHEVVLRPTDMLSAIPKLVWHEDKPIRNASSIALYFVSLLASEHVKVVLTGEGSDELFAGYARYWATMINNRWGPHYERFVPQLIRGAIRRTLWKWPLPQSFKRKLSHTFFNHSMRPEEIIFDNFYAIFPQRIHERLFTRDFYDEVRSFNPYSASTALYDSRKGANQLDRLLYTDQKSYLVELLMKQDRMSMAASIESRVPFLDHKIVEFAAALPSGLKLHHSGGKYIVKTAMQKRVPELVRRRVKMGFPVPIAHWLRQQLSNGVSNILLSSRAQDRNIIDNQFVTQLIRENASGARDHTDAIWTLLNFEIWARVFLDGESYSSVAEELMTRAFPVMSGAQLN